MIIQLSVRYSWIGGHVFYIGLDLEIRRHVREDEMHKILNAYHDEPRGGHFFYKRNDQKALRMGHF